MISHTANFSIWPLFTQGAQVMLTSLHPPATHHRWLTADAVLESLHLSGARLLPVRSFPRKMVGAQPSTGVSSPVPCWHASEYPESGYSQLRHSPEHPGVQGSQQYPQSESPQPWGTHKELRACRSLPHPHCQSWGAAHSPPGTNHPLTLQATTRLFHQLLIS